MKTEIWKYIGISTEYMISNMGRVKSFVKNSEGQILKEDISKKGYRRVTLRYPESRSRHLVHRLVGLAFIPNPENKCCINHIDNNPNNNNASNLEWCTYSENLTHAEKQGRLTEVHKKAGQATAKVLRNRKLLEIDSMAKKTFNSLTVLGLDRISKSKNEGYDYFLKCECKCKTEMSILFEYVINGNVKQCKQCKSESKKNKNYLEAKKNILGNTFHNHTVIYMADFNPEVQKRNIKVQVKCNSCNSVSDKKYSQLFRVDRPIKCKICKD